MRLLFIISMTMVLSSFSYAQTDSDKTSSYDQLTDRTGEIVKFIDFNQVKLPLLPATYANTEVRKVIVDDATNYFYRIVYRDIKGDAWSTSISYKDLKEVITAFEHLVKSSVTDLTIPGDYLENKYRSEDGFEIGYYIKEKKISWFIELHRHVLDRTVFIKDVNKLKEALDFALFTINNLKAKETSQ